MIGNPGDKLVWVKIWDDCAYDVISDSDATPDLTWVVEEFQRRQGILAAQQAIEGKPVTLTAGGPVPVDRYLEEGIEYGKAIQRAMAGGMLPGWPGARARRDHMGTGRDHREIRRRSLPALDGAALHQHGRQGMEEVRPAQGRGEAPGDRRTGE